jgi:DNA-binding response OmpR family regulator
MVRKKATDLVVLDLGLPDMDGLDVVRQIRDGGETLPIIILSSRDNESAKVTALDLGADDYVTKPFGIDELLARIRMAERHRLQQEGEMPLFHAGDLSIGLVRRIVTVGSSEVKLSPREFDVLRLMVAHAGKVLTHRFMLKEIWSSDADVQYLRVYIRAQESRRTRSGLPIFLPKPASAIVSVSRTHECSKSGQLLICRNICDRLKVLAKVQLWISPTLLNRTRWFTPPVRATNSNCSGISHRAPPHLLNLDAQKIVTALQAREELGSTGLGNGFALRHSRLPSFVVRAQT